MLRVAECMDLDEVQACPI